MQAFHSKFIGALIIATMVSVYGCDNSLNTGPDDNNQSERLKVTATKSALSTAANDGLEAVDISGINATDFVTAGTGTHSQNEEEISVEVPAGATIEQVFLYWARRDNQNSPAPSTIRVNGTEFTGSVVGGPVDLSNSNGIELRAAITHRVDLTDVGIVGAGMNNFTVQDILPDPSESLGASVIVFYNNGVGEESAISIFDGVDFLYAPIQSPNASKQEALSTARPVTFAFDPTGAERIAELTLFIGDIEPEDAANRPNSLNITIGNGPTQTFGPTPNPFQAFEGAEWDNFITSLTIPAGVDKVTVEPVSGPGDNPASLVWSLAGLSVPVPQMEEPGGGQGCTPGYWKQSQHFDSWTGFDQEDSLDDPFNIPSDLELAKPEKGSAVDVTLIEALELRGGKVNALIRHAVAALLNASNPDVSYDLTVSEVQSKFNDAVDGGDIEGTKDEFAGFNEQGCPLN